MNRIKTLVLVVGGFTAASVALNATAGPVTLEFQGVTGQGVKIHQTKSSQIPSTQTATAGAFSMENMSTSMGEFIAWCLDIGHTIDPPVSSSTYEKTTNPFTNSYGLSNTEKSRVQDVFDANYDTLDTSNNKQAAGFQLALWNAVYDNDLTLDSGTFEEKINSGARAQADVYLVAADNYADGKKWNITFWQSTLEGDDHSQNLASVSPVPLPAAGYLMFAALIGLGVISRRRRS